MQVNAFSGVRTWGLGAAEVQPRTAAAASSTAGASAEPESSTQVSFSAGAQVLARLAAQGLSMSQHALSAPLTASQGARETPRAQADGYVPVGRAQLESLLGQAGASRDEVQTLVQGLDADGNGELTQDELLQGLARSLNEGGSDFSQALARVMDRLGQADGTVSQQEFAELETRLLAAGQR